MEGVLNEVLVTEIEAGATEMARRAGEILQAHFGRPLEVEYKDKEKQDPVTSVDKESHTYLCEAISRQFPEHGILSEESSPDEMEAPAADFLWVLDPLDGTTNFLNGLPIYAVSIGVLHRGALLAAALFIPWPGEKGGCVLHARRGNGTWLDGERLSIPQTEGPQANRLTGLPASFGAQFRLRKGLRHRVGEVRMTGSIVYELAMTTRGICQYVVFGGPRIWDVAAGALIVMEAGGTVLVRRRRGRRWESLTSLGPSWKSGPPSLKKLRNWSASLIAGNNQIAPFVAANLRSRFHLRARVARLLRRLRRRRR